MCMNCGIMACRITNAVSDEIPPQIVRTSMSAIILNHESLIASNPI